MDKREVMEEVGSETVGIQPGYRENLPGLQSKADAAIIGDLPSGKHFIDGFSLVLREEALEIAPGLIVFG
jgi:hypothetical protein